MLCGLRTTIHQGTQYLIQGFGPTIITLNIDVELSVVSIISSNFINKTSNIKATDVSGLLRKMYQLERRKLKP